MSSRWFWCLALLIGLGLPVRAAGPADRDVADEIDRLLEKRLSETSLKPGPLSDDAEFLRRAHLDLTGKIPTLAKTRAFLDAKSPDRAKLVDELLASPDYGLHFARIWARLIAAEEPAQRPILEKWLTEQFNKNRPWPQVVRDLLIAEGSGPETAFVLSNAENKVVSPAKLAGSTARLFLGVQLQCAECHKHPFTEIQQSEFWGLAAFFSRTRYQTKTKPAAVEESPVPLAKTKAVGAAIVLPNTAGKGSGKVVQARFFQGAQPKLDEKGPYRPALADWVTSRDNAFFARAAVNRVWAHLFGRGLVNPVDDIREENPPSHPAVLDLLARDFVQSDFDLKRLIRVISATRAYQRTSRVGSKSAETEEAELYARVEVKVMNPDALYDSLTQALGVKDLKITGSTAVSGGRGGAKKRTPRAEFIDLFSTQSPESTALDFTHGIPQALSLLNDPQFTRGGPVIDALVRQDPTPDKVVEGLYLSTVNRRPTNAERQRATAWVTRQREPSRGYAGVLWALVNSPEFALIP